MIYKTPYHNSYMNDMDNILNFLPKEHVVHASHEGAYLLGDSLDLLCGPKMEKFKGKINLIVTSPPYLLNSKKSYGNLTGSDYLEWFASLAPIFSELLTEDGSIVLEIGNAWEKGRPVQSLLHLKALLQFAEHPKANLSLIQQFICYNPSRLPSPANWVTVNRIRTVDSYTHVWWFAKSDFPKADNTRVLRPYSNSMMALLKRANYNSGVRPSEHIIGEKSFLTNHGGSIAHNFFEVEGMDPKRQVRLPNAFSMANTSSQDFFSRQCKKRGAIPHPARMPIGLASFFIEFLTTKGDIVLDPFAGSNTTGFAAALAKRKWISIEIQESYIEQSRIRFDDPNLQESEKTT